MAFQVKKYRGKKKTIPKNRKRGQAHIVSWGKPVRKSQDKFQQPAKGARKNEKDNSTRKKTCSTLNPSKNVQGWKKR